MRYRSAGTPDASDIGARVTVRHRRADALYDVIGTLESCDEEALIVRDRHGEPVSIARASVVAYRIVGGKNSAGDARPRD
ncbi:MAG TPA: hypothetical protein VM600_06385 [Actinomycetota bacterium]|nr:hypothetical protein [Actinomycetota bacterium]